MLNVTDKRAAPIFALGLAVAGLLVLFGLIFSVDVARAAPTQQILPRPAVLPPSSALVQDAVAAQSGWPAGGGGVAAAGGRLRYVAADGNDAGDCTQRTLPCRSIQYAVGQSAADDTILVAGGVYTDLDLDGRVLNVDRRVTIEGGYSSFSWTRTDPDANPTVLDGAGAAQVVYIAAGADATLSALYIQGGAAPNGAGVYIAGGLPVLRQSRVYNNTALFNGGGVYVAAGSPRLENNLVYGNTASLERGGGIYVAAGAPRVYHNTLYNNSADERGGGVHIKSGTAVVSATIIVGNEATTGAGVSAEAIGPALDYNDVWGNENGDYDGPVSAGSHSTSTNPLFLDAPMGDFHLQAESHCIDQVPFTQTLPVDYDGLPRPFRPAADMGAYEFYAGTCFVRIGGGPTYTSVQEAVDTAVAGDAVKVAGLCTGTGTGPVADVNVPLTLRGGYTITNWIEPDAILRPTILDGEHERRVVRIGNVAATVWGLHIRNGLAGDGGGIYAGSGAPVIRDNWIYGNTVTVPTADSHGAGVYLAGGTPTVQNNDIHDNTAAGVFGYGGGIYVAGGNALITGNTIHHHTKAASQWNYGGGIYLNSTASVVDNEIYDNQAHFGAGVSEVAGAARIAGNRIHGNLADYQGGGLHIIDSSPTIEDNSIYDNQQTVSATDGGGAGIYIQKSSSPVIRRNTIHDNTALQSGGGIHIYIFGSGPIVTIEKNLFDSNTSGYRGGGMWLRAASGGTTIVVRNNLVTGNSASQGGGIALTENPVTVENNTVYGNSATGGPYGGGIFSIGYAGSVLRNNIIVSNVNYGIYWAGSATTAWYSDIWNNTAGQCGGSITCLPADGNISANPQLVNPAGGDLHLQVGSPCVDTADPANFPADDYTGWARPFGTRADMGAYELYSGTCFARKGSGGQVYDWPQKAVDALPNDPLIKVAGICRGTELRNGTYQTVYIDHALTLRGGYTLTNWIEPSTISILDAQGTGRGIYATGSGPVTVESLVVRNGSANTGGGLFLATPMNATVQNVIFHGNSATNGGGLAITGGSPHLFNNTFAFNSATRGGGVYLTAGSAHISNTIAVSNTASQSGGGFYAAAGTPVLGYNDVWHNSGGNYGGMSPGATDFSGDPHFTDPAGRDLHLEYTSVCIHRGDPNTTPAIDVEGDPRPLGHADDVGADEATHYPDVWLAPDLEASGIPGFNTVHQHTLTNTGTITDTFYLTHTLTTFGEGTGWSVSYVPVVTLEAGIAVPMPVTIGVPADTFSGSYAIVLLTARSKANPEVYGTASNKTIVNWNPGVDIEPQYMEYVNPGAIITYVHTVTNTGNAPDTFQVRWGSSQGWTTVTPAQLNLGPHVTATVLARLVVPPTMPGGLVEHNQIVVESTQPNSGASDLVDNTFTVLHKPGDRYVSVTGTNHDNNCLVFSVPCETVEYAAGQAVTRDTVKVSFGNYHEHDILLNKEMVLQGGYSLDWQVLDPVVYPTVIDADGLGRVLNIVGNPTVQGLHLVDGLTNGSGAAVYIGAGAPVLRGNWLHNNHAVFRGGAIYHALGSATIDGNRIYDNTADVAGAGVYVAQGNPAVWNNWIYHNTTDGRGGGLATALGPARLWHNTFYANAAGYGGGLAVLGGSPTISNTIVAANTATVAGGGIYLIGGTPGVDYNDAWNNTGGDYGGGLVPGEHSLSVDPVFVDAPNDDLHLMMTSPCQDQGDTTVVKLDIDRGPRWVGHAPDLGADEYLITELALEPDQSGFAYPWQVITYTHVLTNYGNYTDTVSFGAATTHGWDTQVPMSVTLGPGMTSMVVVNTVVSSYTLSGTVETMVVSATSGLNPDVVATAVDSTEVGLLRGVLLEPPRVGRADSNASQPVTVYYSHLLTNTTNYTDTFHLSGTSQHSWQVSVSPQNVTLAMGQSIAVQVSVTAPPLPPTPVYADVAVITAVSQSDSSVSDPVTDTTILNQDIGVLLNPDITVDALPGDLLTFDHTLQNTGNYTDTFSLDYFGDAAGAFVGPTRITLKSNQTVPVQFQLIVPMDAACNTPIQALLRATSEANTFVWDSAIDTVNVGAVAWGSALQPEGLARVASNASVPVTVHYVHTLTNNSNCPQTFLLSASASYPGFSASVTPNSITLQGGAETTVNVTVVVPPKAPTCANLMVDTTTVVAQGQYDTATATDTTIVNQCMGVLVEPDNSQVVSQPATGLVAVTYEHVVTNTGNYIDTFSLTVNSDQGWGTLVQPSEVTLNSGAHTHVQVVVQVPPDVYDVTDSTAITATSESDPNVFDAALDETVVARPHVTLAPDRRADARDGMVVTYTHALVNDGVVPDSYTLVHDDVLGWPTTIAPDHVDNLPAKASVPVTVTVVVPPGIVAGTVNTAVITATSTTYPIVYDTATDVTSVPRIPDAVLEPECDGSADPGTSVVCTHVLRNAGNYTETFHLDVHPDRAYAEVSPTDIGPLAPGESFGPVNVTVYLPAYAESGWTENTEIIISFAQMPGQVATVDSTYVNYVNGTRYVATDGNDPGNNCLDLDYGPCSTAQHAVDQSLYADTVQVATGVYSDVHDIGGNVQVLSVNKTVTVRGGYARGDWSHSYPGAYPSILDANGHGRVVVVPQASTAPVIDGLELIHGNAVEGGGVYVGLGAMPTIRLSSIYSNTATNGGGLYFAGGAGPTIERNVIRDNSADQGAGLYLFGGSATVWNNLLYDNVAQSRGGGVYTIYGSPLLRHNTLFANTAFSSPGGGGIYIGTGTPTVDHNILISNTGYGLYNVLGTPVVAYNDFWNNMPADSSEPLDPNSFEADPRLVDLQARDLHLLGSSPCVDAGDAALGSPDEDLEGNPRPMGEGRDIGAYEYKLLTAKWAPATAPAGGIITYTVVITNAGQVIEQHAMVTDVLPGNVDFAGLLDYSTGAGEYVPASRSVTWEGPVYTATATLITFTARITDWLAPGEIITNVGWVDGAPTNVATTYVAAAPGTRYVTPAGSNTRNNCRVSWRPCQTVQYALDRALSGDAVNLAAGTYTDTLASGQVANISKAGALIGGFDGATWVYDPDANPTTLDGLGANQEVLVSGAVDVTVAGLRLHGATHGVDSMGATLTISRCHVTDHLDDGIVASGGQLVLLTSWVHHNGGDGVQVTGGPYLLANNVLALNNQAGLRAGAASGELIHNTLADNGVVGAEIGGTATLTNTIISGHPTGIAATAGSAAAMTHTVWHANGTDKSGNVTSTVDLSGDPVYIDPAATNYHLRSQSIALDAGLDTGLSIDIDLATRPLLAAPDIGADEYPLAVVKHAPATAQAGQVIQYVIAIQGQETALFITDTLHPYLDYAGTVACSQGTCGYLPAERAIVWNGSVDSPPQVAITFTARITDWLASGVSIPNHVEVELSGDHFATQPVQTVIVPTPGTRYVTPGGDNTENNCRVSTRPCVTIQYAVDQAVGGDEVRVAGGSYAVAPGTACAVQIAKSLALVGGFAPDAWADRDPVAHPTLIDAQGAGDGVCITGPAGVSVIGFQVIASGGRGVSVDGAAVRLEGNQISGHAGAGVWLSGSEYTLVNNIVAGNTHGVWAMASTGQLAHNTLAANGPSGATIGGSAVFTDTIVAGQQVGIAAAAGSTAEMLGTLWYGNTTDTQGSVTHQDDTYGDPRFVSPAGGNYHLRGDSPAMNAGTWAGVGEDVDRDTRPAGQAPDLGADQYPLRVDRWLSPAEPAPCGVVTHTIELSNLSRAPMAGVSLGEPLPGGTGYGGWFEANNGSGGYSGGAIRWNGGVDLARPTLMTFTVQIDGGVADGTVIVHSARVTDAISSFASLPASVTVRTVDGTLEKLGPDEATIGEVVPYTVQFTVPGGHGADQLVLVDHLPAPAMTYVPGSASPPPAAVSPDGGTITWTLPAMSAPCGDPQAVVVSFGARVANIPGNVQGAVLTNETEIDYRDAGSVKEHHIEAEHSLTVVEPEIVLDKSVTPEVGLGVGDPLYVTLAISNTGESVLYDGVLTDTLPDQLEFLNATPGYVLHGQTVSWTLPSLGPGETAVYNLTAEVGAGVEPGMRLVNHARLAGTSQPGVVPAERSYAATDEAEVYIGYPDLTVAKYRGPDLLSPGLPITYTIEFGNAGIVPAMDVRVADVLPADVTVVVSRTSVPADVQVSGQAITWTLLSPLVPGAGGTVWITGLVALDTPDYAVLLNTAIITGASPDDNPDDNTSTVSTLVRHPALTIGKVASPSPVPPGQPLVYTLTMHNTGGGQATELVVTDSVPAGTTFQSCSGGDGCSQAGGVVTWQLDSLAAGQSVQLGLTVLVGAGAQYGTSIVNTTYGVTCLQGKTATGAPVSVPVAAAGTLQLVANQNGGGKRGQHVVYNHTLTNATNAAQTINLQPHSSLGWTVTVAPSTVSLAAGASRQVVVTVVIPAAAPSGAVDVETIVATGSIVGTATVIDTTAVSVYNVYLPLVMRRYQ